MSNTVMTVKSKKESYGLSAVWQQLETVKYISRAGRFQQMLWETVNSIKTNPVTALFSLISISSALFVLGLFLLIFQNVGHFTQDTVQQLNVSVYIKDRLTTGDVEELSKLIEQRGGVKSVSFVSKEEALELFTSALDESDRNLFTDAEANPLPASLEIKLQDDISRPILNQLISDLKDLPGILHVGYATEIFDRSKEFITFVKVSGALVVLIMLLVTAFVITSTIRMMLLQRENELAIMRLVGATSFLIRFPCWLEGASFGLVGAVIALSILNLFFHGLLASSRSVTEMFPALGELQFLHFTGIFLVVFVGTSIGLFSSFIAARRV